MTLLIKTTQMDRGCHTSSHLHTWLAVYAGQVQSAKLLINTQSCTIDEEWWLYGAPYNIQARLFYLLMSSLGGQPGLS